METSRKKCTSTITVMSDIIFIPIPILVKGVEIKKQSIFIQLTTSAH